MELTRSIKTKVDSKWSALYSGDLPRSDWWQNPYIIRHINQRICGSPLNGASAGLTIRAREMAGDRLPFTRGISVGSGNAYKEIELICQGVVESFVLFELSDIAIKHGKILAKKRGVEDRIEYFNEDAFEKINKKECFDFVHWNNSLHHMLDVEKAIEWSYRICEKGGMFYLDDFVGPTRFQWSDRTLQIASAVRKALPEKYFFQPPKGGCFNLYLHTVKRLLGLKSPVHPKTLNRPNVNEMIHDDPSEAADSERILESVKRWFPNAEIKLTGGVVYFLALGGILHNFDESKDKRLLDLLLLIDDLCIELGENQYATVLAIK